MYNEKYFYYLCIILIVGRVKAICKYFRSKVKSFPITIKTFYRSFFVAASGYA